MHLKFYFLTSVLLLFFGITSYSQKENQKGKFNIGIQAGPQFTNISNYNSYFQMNSKTGYTFGIFSEYFVIKDLKMRLGTYFDNRKYEKYSILTPISSMDYTGYNSFFLQQINYSLNYLTIPINIIYQNGNEKIKVFVQFGLYYSLLLNATQNGSSDLYIDPEDAEHFDDPVLTPGHHLQSFIGSVKSDYKSSELGINFYLGGWFKISQKISLTFSPGLTYSFTQVFSNPDINSKWNSMVKIDAGIIFCFTK